MLNSGIADKLKKAQRAVMGSGDVKATQLEESMVAPDTKSRITSDFGVRQSNTDDWLRIATDDRTGPMLLEDPFAREKIHRFDHERIPERVVHARGAGAFGTFRLNESAEDVTYAGVLTDTSRETPVFVRFSTVLGSRGSADTVRDVRGFAIKFYTQEGNWDLVGNNIPVFFIQDAMKFPDLVHAGKPEPHNEIPQAQTAHNNFWDFVFMHSEATHMFMWAMSDRAIPRSYRMMQGFGVNTFTLVNAQGQRSFVKFHLTPELGVHSLVWDEALKIAGQDPDFHRKDLWEAIDAGTFPKWKFGIQVLPESREHEFDFDVLDATKIWPEELVPIRYIGELELNRNVDEYFPQTEQVAFCTSHIVPGIGFSDDPLLQGRNFSYFDTQLSRLGTNWEELPINRAVCPVMNFNRDGAMRHTISKGTVNYWPNRRQTMPPASHQEGGYIDYAERVQGVKARAKGKKFKDHFSQARLFLNSLSPIEKKHVQAALGFELDHCDDRVVYDRVAYERLAQIDISLAKAVAELVGAKVPESAETTNTGKKSKGLSQLEYLPKDPIIASRKVAIIVADGYDALAFEAIVDALKGGKAIPVVIGTKRSQISPAGQSNPVTPDHHLEGMRSTLFDAVFVPGGEKSVATLSKNGRAMHWIREAFGHLKAIGATGEAVDLVRHAVQLDGVKVSENHDVCVSYGVVTLQSVRPEHLSEALDVVKDGNGFVSKFVTAISSHRCWDREMDGLSDMVAF